MLSENDKKLLAKIAENDFLPLKYHGGIYFVSERLLDNEYLGDDFIKAHGLDEVISKLEKHLDLEIITPKEKLPDSKAEIIIVYGRNPERQNVFPAKDRVHTSLLMENTSESAGNGYGSRVLDELVKGGDQYLDHLPTPEEMEKISDDNKPNDGMSIIKTKFMPVK